MFEAHDGNSSFVVLDGQRGLAHKRVDTIGPMTFSDDGTHLAYMMLGMGPD